MKKHDMEARIHYKKRAQANVVVRNQHLTDFHIAVLQGEHTRLKELTRAMPQMPMAGELKARKRTIKQILRSHDSYNPQKPGQGIPMF